MFCFFLGGRSESRGTSTCDYHLRHSFLNYSRSVSCWREGHLSSVIECVDLCCVSLALILISLWFNSECESLYDMRYRTAVRLHPVVNHKQEVHKHTKTC